MIDVRAGRVESFELDDHFCVGTTDDPPQTNDRRAADRFQHRIRN
jgi:hypothetical protein